MIALFDIGNTRTKYCMFDKGKRSTQQATLNRTISDTFLDVNFVGVSKIIIASVSNAAVTSEINTWCQKNNVVFKQVFSELKKNCVVSGYKDPKQLGVDRWLGLIGAANLYPKKNVLIIDAGTATTIDFLLASGQHQGGWILAGIKTLIASVLAETTQVQANLRETESVAFGLNTSENVHNAAWAATVGAIHLAITEIQKQGLVLGNVIITGGNGNLLASLMTHEYTVIEELVFNGLEAYIE